ncbi:MAG: hypothetical protein IJ188_02710 [Clostridia bacterium]|nr:hypothetical protein [Clostridia bacterium]
MKMKQLFCAALSALFLWSVGASFAEAATEAAPLPSLDWLEEKGLTLGESVLSYPALREGLLEAELTQTINEQILTDGQVREYVTRLSQLISGGRLNVSWKGTILGPVFSFALAAEGAVATPRNSFVWTGGNIDLRDGHEVSLKEIFTDPEAAQEAIEEYLEWEVAPELSAHLLNSQLTPLPERFFLNERGIIYLYPIDQLSTLSDRAGAVLIPWRVVKDQLDLSEEGLLSAMGVAPWMAEGTDTAAEVVRASVEELRSWVEKGRLPGIPAGLGDSLQALTEEHHLLIDPDVYALGRLFSLEGAEFREVFLMTDFLSESWENSIVDGIRMDLGNFFGLVIGDTPREAWLEALGEPDHTLELGEEEAEAYRTGPGVRDYYEIGGNRLQLQANEDGILCSVILSE